MESMAYCIHERKLHGIMDLPTIARFSMEMLSCRITLDQPVNADKQRLDSRKFPSLSARSPKQTEQREPRVEVGAQAIFVFYSLYSAGSNLFLPGGGRRCILDPSQAEA